MENLPNNLRGTVAQLEGIELRRPQNLYMHKTSESTQQKDRPDFEYFEDFFNEINQFRAKIQTREKVNIQFKSLTILVVFRPQSTFILS